MRDRKRPRPVARAARDCPRCSCPSGALCSGAPSAALPSDGGACAVEACRPGASFGAASLGASGSRACRARAKVKHCVTCDDSRCYVGCPRHKHTGRALSSTGRVRSVRVMIITQGTLSRCTCSASSKERQRRMMTQLLPSSPASGPLATFTSVSRAATCTGQIVVTKCGALLLEAYCLVS